MIKNEKHVESQSIWTVVSVNYGVLIYVYLCKRFISPLLLVWFPTVRGLLDIILCDKECSGADPGFQVRRAHLKKLRRAEGGANIFGVFRVKNITPKNHIFSNFRGHAPGAPPPGSASGDNDLLLDAFSPFFPGTTVSPINKSDHITYQYNCNIVIQTIKSIIQLKKIDIKFGAHDTFLE